MKYRAHVAKHCVLKAEDKMKSLYEGLYPQKEQQPSAIERIQAARMVVKSIFAR